MLNISYRQIKVMIWLFIFLTIILLVYQNTENTVNLDFLWFTFSDIPVFLIIAFALLAGAFFYLFMQFFFGGRKSYYKSDEL
ncbi:MAG TPA: hypothetical protein VKS21_05660 [Spirochaetota bacterium]|nr:hypothetical protein [Spirochaetota bacterium]